MITRAEARIAKAPPTANDRTTRWTNSLMAYDRNRDGRIVGGELPARMQAILQYADANRDGAVDRNEALAYYGRVR